MGKMQRDKGYREEVKVVVLFRNKGYEAKRIPLSGMCEGFEGDVVIKKPGEEKSTLLEVKSSTKRFKSVYEYYFRDFVTNNVTVKRFSYKDEKGDFQIVSIGTNYEDVIKESDFPFIDLSKIDKKDQRAIKNIVKYKALKASSDILVLRQNHSQHLFIKYW